MVGLRIFVEQITVVGVAGFVVCSDGAVVRVGVFETVFFG